MAGIGFELRRVIGRGGLSRTLGAALSGILVVAGPWIMTILSIFLIHAAFSGSGFRFTDQFQVVVIYSYAGSLALFSGVHFLFTRIIADLVWEDRREEASGWLLRFVLVVILLSAAVSGAVLSTVSLEVGDRPGLYRMACVLLFVSVNVMWVVMLFVSLLRRYLAILVVFAAGMAAAVGLVALWSVPWGAGGAVLGYAAGHSLAAAGLLALSFSRYRPKFVDGGLNFIRRYIRKYRALILSGACFYLGQWADKFVFWALRGERVEGTPWRLYADYDVPVYLAGLSIVPGLVYFVLYSETEIASSLRHFLNSLGRETLSRIRFARQRLGADIRREFRDQSLFQLAFSVGAALFLAGSGGALLGGPGRVAAGIVAIAGAYFQFSLMTLLNFLYYFELFGTALAGSALFLVLNGGAFSLVQAAFPALPPGSGYLASTAAAALFCWAALLRSVPSLDRSVFLRSIRRDVD